MYSTTLKKRFCKDTNIPINLFQEPYFSERLKLYDNVFNSLKKWETFIHSLYIYNNEEEYLNYFVIHNKCIFSFILRLFVLLFQQDTV